MPQNTPCERCHRVGLVHVERIITGTRVTLVYFCGACDHTWEMVTPDPHRSGQVTLRRQKDRRQTA